MSNTTTPFWQQYIVSIFVFVLALASLLGAVILVALHDDAGDAWKAFAGFSVLFAGVHISNPGQQSTS